MYIIEVRILYWDWGVSGNCKFHFYTSIPTQFLALNMWINLKYNLNVDAELGREIWTRNDWYQGVADFLIFFLQS